MATGTPIGVFVHSMDLGSGAPGWTRQWGTSGDSYVSDLEMDSHGALVVTGHTTGNFADPDDEKANSQLFVLKVVP